MCSSSGTGTCRSQLLVTHLGLADLNSEAPSAVLYRPHKEKPCKDIAGHRSICEDAGTTPLSSIHCCGQPPRAIN